MPSVSSVGSAPPVAPPAVKRAPVETPATPVRKQDSVTISAEAQALLAGDKDHDGDSH